ncbi:hypothetical protein Lser_V15G14165 [Lactuca serriola]
MFAVSSTLMQQVRQVITGSWDKILKCWDPRGGGA